MKRIIDPPRYRKHKVVWIKSALLHDRKIQRFKDRILRLLPKIMRCPLSSLLLVGIALRLALAPLTSDPNDTVVWYIVSNDSLAGLNVYTTRSFSYPPLWAYVLCLMAGLASSFTSPKLFGVQLSNLNLPLKSLQLPATITSPLFNILYKVPLIVADAVIGLLIYSVVKDLRNEESAKNCFLLWFFNPLVIVINSVHGQFDVLPVLMTVLSLVLFYKHNYFISGIALGIGVLFKLYPFLLFPFYLFMAASLERDGSSKTVNYVKNTAFQCSKFIAGMILAALSFLVLVIGGDFFYTVFARTRVLSSLGGMSLLSVAYLPGFEWILQLIAENTSAVSQTLIALGFTLSLLVGFICFHFGRGRFLKALVLGHVAVLVIIYMTSFTINPQHILWIIPFLILSYGLFSQYLVRLSVLSVLALIFLIGLGGPFFFLYTMAVSTSLLTINEICTNTEIFQQSVGGILLLFSTISGTTVLLSLLASTLKSLLRLRSKHGTISLSLQRGKEKLEPLISWHKITPTKILALVFIVSMAGQFLISTQQSRLQNTIFIIDNYDFSDENRIEVWYRISSGSYPEDVQILAMPVANPVTDKDVFFYYDEAYPSSLVGKASWIGLWDHITIELQLRGYRGSVKRVDATQLRYVMQENNDSIIIIPSGVFPGTIHTKNESLVGNWLQSGCTLIWIGDIFAYYSGHKGKEIEFVSEDNPGWEGQIQTLGFYLLNQSAKENERFATVPTDFSDALDLRYPDAFAGALVCEVWKHAGLALGKITSSEDARTSIAHVPIGNGHLILFGGGIGREFTVTGEDVIANDVAQILCSGFLSSAESIVFKTYELGKNEEREGMLTITISKGGENPEGVIIIAFSKSPYVRFFARQVIFRD